MVDRVYQNQATVASIRKGNLSPELVNVLTAVGNELDVYFDVNSGGQPTKAEGGARTGSDRHDHGNSADTKVYVLNSNGSKRYLDFNNSEDKALLGRVVQLSVAGGAKGVGAGNDYMGGKTLHIGFGKAGAWGAKGKSVNAPDWLKEAYNLGTKTPPMNIPDVATALDTKGKAPIPATLSRGVDMARTKYAANVANTPLPRPRPDAVSGIEAAFPMSRGVAPGDKMSAADVGNLYKGIYPASTSGTTSAAPIPATMSPALQAARARLATARQTASNPAAARTISDPLNTGKVGMSVTPKVPGNYDFTQNVSPTAAEVAASKANTPGMDVSPIQSRAIILDEGVGALGNPRSFSPGTLNPGPKVDPIGNGASLADLNAMKQGTMPPLPRPRPETPTTADPANTPTATPAKMVKLASGKMAPVGATNVSGDSVWTVVDNGDGTGKMVKANAGILKELSANTVAGGIARQKVGEAIGQGTDAAVTAAKPIVDTVGKAAGDLFGQAGNMLGGLFGGVTAGKPDSGAGIKLSIPIEPAKPKAGTTLAIPAAKSGAALAPMVGTRGLQNIHDRNAVAMGYGEIAPTPATMPANLRQGNALPATPQSTITVKKAQPAAAPKIYQSGGYVYSANPAGGYIKIGKMVNGSAVMNGGGTSVTAKPAATTSKSSSSSSSGVPAGYKDLGNGKFQSESGGIYYTRNL